MNEMSVEIGELIEEWAAHGLLAFHGYERSEAIDAAIRAMFNLVFDVGKKAIDGLGGQEFGLTWGDCNHISIHLDDIPDGALIIKV